MLAITDYFYTLLDLYNHGNPGENWQRVNWRKCTSDFVLTCDLPYTLSSPSHYCQEGFLTWTMRTTSSFIAQSLKQQQNMDEHVRSLLLNVTFISPNLSFYTLKSVCLERFIYLVMCTLLGQNSKKGGAIGEVTDTDTCIPNWCIKRCCTCWNHSVFGYIGCILILCSVNF